jgi:hypothetical protein
MPASEARFLSLSRPFSHTSAPDAAPADELIVKKLGELRRRMQQGESARAGMAAATPLSSQPAWGRRLAPAPPAPTTTTTAVEEGVVAANPMESGVARSARAGGGQAPPMLRQVRANPTVPFACVKEDESVYRCN